MRLRNISGTITRVMLSLSLAITIAIATLNNQSTTVQADHVGDIITVVVNSMSSESKAGTATIPNGVSQARTGYLCYLIKPDGSNYSSNAIALYSPGFNGLSGSSWIAKTRTNLTAGSWKEQADWNCTPWTSSGTSVISHEPEIKQYFQDKDATGVENSQRFVKKYWGETAMKAFEKDECYIVIETLMNFQYSELGSGSGTLTSEQQTEIWNKCKEQAAIEVKKVSDPVQELEDEGADITDLQAIWKKRYVKGDYIVMSWSDYCRSLLIQKWTADAAEGAKRELKDTLGSARKMIGTPLIGTVPNLISAKSELGTTTTVFNSYLNNAACHAEQLQKSEAGFTVGASSGVLSDSEVATQGVAMMIIHYNDTSIQSTCDEPLQPDPHDPPDESTGDVSIVKNYRTEDGGTYTEDGCFIRNDLSNELMIEDETDYKVVGWKVTSQTSPEKIDSINWNPPGTVGQTGDTVGTVTLNETKEHTLYVLLEKSQDTPETPPETPNYDYLLTETQITKQSKLSSPDNFVHVPSTLLQFKFSRGRFVCNGHHVPTTHNPGHSSSCATDCSTDHSYTCDSGCTAHTYYCTWRSWTDNSIKYSIKNTNWDAYKTILVTKAGASGVEVKRGETTKWTVSLSESTVTNYYKNDFGDWWTWPGGDNHWSSAKDEWDYLFLLARGDDKLTVAQWVNAGQAKPVSGTDGTFSNANDNLKNLSTDTANTYFTVASKKSSTGYSRYKDNENAKFSDLSQGKTGYYIKKFNMKFDKDTVTSGVDYDVSANPSAGSTGGTCTLQTITYGLVNGDGTTYSKGPLEIKDITVKIEVYTGQETLDPAPTYDTSDKIVFKNSRAIQKHTTSGIMVPTNTEIKFTPYVRMKYDTLTTTDLTAYVLGEYERSITPNDYAEIEWDYYNKDGIYNLQINSSQWSTHAQAYKDYGSGGKVLPGGATLSLKETDDGRRTLKVRTYQTILEGKGLTQVLNTTGTTTNPLPESDSSGNSIVEKRHDDYANSVVEALSQTMIRQYVSTNASLENPMDVCVDSNVVNPDSNINLNNGSSKTSSESKYYLRTEDEYKEKSNSARLDATITSTGETGRYTFRADYKGNIYMNDKFILSKNQSYTDLKDATAKELDDKTYIVRKLLAAIQRDGGNDTSAKWVTDGHWYNEAMDGITIVVRESTIKTGLWNPAERHMVLDPKLIPSAEKNGSKVQNTKGTLFNCYFSSAFRTDNYSSIYGASSQEKIGEFESRGGVAYSVKLTEYKTLYVSDKVFYIPNVTTQDLN